MTTLHGSAPTPRPCSAGWPTEHGGFLGPKRRRANGVRGWGLVGIQLDRREAIMAGKDKGGRSTKTPAAKSAKEKRQAKKDKKAAKADQGRMP